MDHPNQAEQSMERSAGHMSHVDTYAMQSAAWSRGKVLHGGITSMTHSHLHGPHAWGTCSAALHEVLSHGLGCECIQTRPWKLCAGRVTLLQGACASNV